MVSAQKGPSFRCNVSSIEHCDICCVGYHIPGRYTVSWKVRLCTFFEVFLIENDFLHLN